MELIHGFRLVAANPRLWKFCVVPLLFTLGLYLALGVALFLLVGPWIAGLAAAWGVTLALGNLIAGVAVVALWALMFIYGFVLVTGITSSWMWDRLSLEIEKLDGGAPETKPLPLGPVIADSLARLLFNTAVAVVALLLTLFLGPFPGWLAAGFIGLLDFTAPAMLRRRITLGGQFGRVVRGRGLPFGALVGLFAFLPLVNVLLFPVFVAGGTLLVRRLGIKPAE